MAKELPMVLPVRFSGGGLSMQTTTSRLGAQGAYLRCMLAPKEGTRVQLWLTLPQAPRPVEVSATVIENPSGAGQERGFAVRFDEVSAEGREHLQALLGEHGAAEPAAAAHKSRGDAEPPGSKRVYARLSTRIQVGWSSAREFLVAYSENISRGGIFVVTKRPPPLREVVELFLELPDGGPPARTNAEVVQCVTEEIAQSTRRTAGAGLQFVGGDDEFRQRLDACIEHLLAQEG